MKCPPESLLVNPLGYYPQLPELLDRFKGLPEVELMVKVVYRFYDSHLGGCTVRRVHRY